jgi:hypothetical protein
MGYLYENLPFGRGIAPCADFYIYAMFVYFQRADRYAALKPKTILAQVIGTVLPDVEDWQLAGSTRDFIVFRFHDPTQRIAAQVELLITKITFTQTGSTVLPSGQVFPAPPPPPPPFPDLGPIITQLQTQVNQLEQNQPTPPSPGRLDSPSVDFDYTSPPTIQFDVAAIGDIILRADVVIVTAFNDPNATIALGTIANPGILLPANSIDPTTIGTYSNSGDFPMTTTTGFLLQVSPGASTQGAGVVVITIRRST